MERFRRPLSGEGELPEDEVSLPKGGHRRSDQGRTPYAYRIAEGATEGLLYFMVVFTPWAYGTTETWSIWTMNIAGYALGAILLGKWIVRWTTGFRPARWGDRPAGALFDLERDRRPYEKYLTVSLAVLTGLILTYCLVAAVNARAEYMDGQRRFEYYEALRWLPHSYDSPQTWLAFWTYLGLACSFWAARDWLLGKTRQERQESRQEAEEILGEPLNQAQDWQRPVLTSRLRRLLWVLCINVSLLALVSILQRLDGTNKLLWMREPRLNKTAEAQFGPYAYRANAAAYINLVWPVCLGFWMMLRNMAHQARRPFVRIGGGSHVLLLPGAVLMAACPIISTSRGAAFVAMALILVVVPILLRGCRHDAWPVRAGILGLFLVVLSFSGYLGWQRLEERIENVFVDRMSGRGEIYDNALLMARDFPIYGTGPGTFTSLYQLYREPQQGWAGYVHDDWLETRITFGWVGTSMLLLALLIVFVRWFGRGGIPMPPEFAALTWVALGGCLLHAKYDFPFQIYSILFLFLLLCSVMLTASRKP